MSTWFRNVYYGFIVGINGSNKLKTADNVKCYIPQYLRK